MAGKLVNVVLPALISNAAALSVADLLSRVIRAANAICLRAAGVRQGTCNQLSNDLATVQRHVTNGAIGPARNVLDAVAPPKC
jgi:copper homeostasis protein CutC